MKLNNGDGFPEPGNEKPRVWADGQRLVHIEGLSKNARGTWFALTASLLFSAIAVAGVQDRDFFTYDSGLTLPVINFSVPVKSFFAVAPLLILGLYVYLHLYLAKLWRSLGEARPKLLDGRYLDDAVFPWLISDAAIFLKPGGPRRLSGRLAVVVTVLFLWISGPAVLFLFWWRSFPPHDALLSIWTGFLFCLSLFSGFASFSSFMRWIKGGSVSKKVSQIWKDFYSVTRFAVVAILIGTIAFSVLRSGSVLKAPQIVFGDTILAKTGWLTFGGEVIPAYSANLYRTELVERPQNWLPRRVAKTDALVRYSGLKPLNLHNDNNWQENALEVFDIRRKSMLDGLKAKDFRGWNFRHAEASEAFLPGADLRHADFSHSVLSGAVLEMAELSSANLQGAVLWRTDLQEANLEDANLQGVDLARANLKGANLRETNLRGARLFFTNLDAANLYGADMRNADLRRALLRNTDLSRTDLRSTRLDSAIFSGKVTLRYADLQGADLRAGRMSASDLSGADMQGAKLSETDFQEADFERSKLQGADLYGSLLNKATLVGANLQGANLQFAVLHLADVQRATFQGAFIGSTYLQNAQNLTQSQINVAYGDASTLIPASLKRPNTWARTPLPDVVDDDDDEAIQRWTAWQVSQTAKELKENTINF